MNSECRSHVRLCEHLQEVPRRIPEVDPTAVTGRYFTGPTHLRIGPVLDVAPLKGRVSAVELVIVHQECQVNRIVDRRGGELEESVVIEDDVDERPPILGPASAEDLEIKLGGGGGIVRPMIVYLS